MQYVVICLGFGLAGGLIGRIKGSSFFLWFAISALIPVLGLAAAILYRNERDEVRRECPNCGSVIKLHDQVCMHCGEDLEFPDTAIVPESVAAERR
jgi:ribosomal protein S27AE